MTSAITKAIDTYLVQQEGYEEVVKMISEHISHLINNDFSAFVQLLYKLDIDEKHFHKERIIDTEEIAKIIIAREVQRYEYRRKQGHNDAREW